MFALFTMVLLSVPASRFILDGNLFSSCNMQSFLLCIVAILSTVFNRYVTGVPLANFYPFGSTTGDTALQANDDDSSPPITLSMPFSFFAETHAMVFVNNNGVISFQRAVTRFTSIPFPLNDDVLTEDLELIAPYWADVDTRGAGTVWYRETDNLELRTRAAGDIRTAFNQSTFLPMQLFIATWERVGYFSQHTDLLNTFQCVMATDGMNSFVIFLYGEIQWTTGDSSGGSGGLGGTQAQVGFNAGDGVRFASVPGSQTADIININTTTNVGIPGVWIFQVDEGVICVNGVPGNRSCSCFIGFTGPSCETNIDDCASILCLNGGSCIDGENSFTCNCADGFTGVVCETNINDCAPNPCQNGGSCSDGVNSFTCNCADGFTGVVCETNINDCAPNPCQNGGSCSDGVNSFTCNCADGFTGVVCERNINDCASNPCQNGGSCSDGVNSFTCSCANGFTGVVCERNINDCAPNPCLNGGSCSDGVNSFTCNCADGFTGVMCERNINDCAPNPCQNGGSCSDGVNSFTCNCADGFTGDMCETNINDCAPNPCQNGGSCSDGVNSFTCDCVDGFTGVMCETNINDCAPNPCQNGGSCSDGVNSFTCDCVDGFTGVMCETNINDCAPNPCQNGGSCSDGVNSFTCNCVDGFIGVMCENINDCISNPCQNGGSCSDGINSFTCNCADGFTGVMCETNINDCAPNPCQNGGSCSDGVNSFTCNCADGFNGVVCETNINDCASNPCLNEGSCSDGVNSFTCNCADGFTGVVCGTNINDCAPNPCQNGGSCSDRVDSFTCNCADGFTGTVCETNINDCASNPCLNGGSCIDGVNSFTCNCADGFTGVVCEINIDDCASNPCQNGGSCSDGVNSFTCVCVDGFNGEICGGFRCRSEELSIPGDFVCDRISDCFGGEDEVNCAAVNRPECSGGDIRLIGGATDAEGVVQVCLNGTYTQICRSGWDIADATVVCRQLGRPGDVGIPVNDAREFGVDAEFQNSSFVLSDFGCVGEEDRLLDCRSRPVRICPFTTPVGVICRAPETCVDGDVRLVDGADEREGRVEVCRSGIWGAVTDNLNITTGWTFNDAAVVCSQLRFNPLGALPIVPSTFNGRSPTVLLSTPQCRGGEDSLRSCEEEVPNQFQRRISNPVFPNLFENIVAVRCDDYPDRSDCADGDVRLTHRDRTNATGQVQICIDETWNSLSGGLASWNDAAASVVCRQLGFIGEGSRHRAFLGPVPGPGTRITGADFELGRSCDGTEENLLLCPLMEFEDGDNQDVGVQCEALPTLIVSPPSDGTYTVEVGRELEVTCQLDLSGVRNGDGEPPFSVVAFREGDPESEISGAFRVPVVNFTGSRGSPASASGLYRCVVLSLETQTFLPQTEQNITVNIQVPSGTGSSAVLEFSVPEFQRFREAGEMVTQEEQLEMFANQVFQSIDVDTVGLQDVSCSYLEREVIDMERNLERVGCNITTFPAPESTVIANPIAIAQSVALLLGATNPMLSRFDVSAAGFCDRENTVTSAGNYSWPMSAAEISVSLPCVFGAVDESSTGTATRECGPVGDWMEPNLSQCRSSFDIIETMNVTAENYDDIISNLATGVDAADFPGEQNEDNLGVVTDVFQAAAQLVSMDPAIIDPETVNQTLEIVDIIQNWTNTSLLGQEGPGIINSFESIVIGLVEQENFTRLVFTGEATSFIAERVPVTELRDSGRGFSSNENLDPATGDNQNTRFEVLDTEQIASAYLPPELFDELVSDDSAEEIGVFFSIYEDAVLLPVVGVDNSTIVGSSVVAATVGGTGPVENLNNPAIILVRLNELEFGTPINPRCVSYDFVEGNWTTEGCNTTVSENDSRVIRCDCNHLTNFASLVDICSRTDGCRPISPAAEVALEVLSYIGVVLSMVGIILTIITLLVFKKLRMRDASKYHIQLCVAIFCVLLIFVAGVDRTGNYGGCVAVSALIHYFTLVAVMWMGAEALLMFQKLIIVFSRITTNFIIAVSIICWTVPFIPVVIPLAIDRDFMVSFREDNPDEIRFCFIGDRRVFFGAFLAPIFTILAFNAVIFVMVIAVLVKHAKKYESNFKVVSKEQADKNLTLRLLISITGVMFLFGLTWIFGALTISDASLVFQFFFVIFNAFQGFFIFLFFCVFSKEARELWRETLSCGRYKSKLLHTSQAGLTPSTGAAKKPNNLLTSTLPRSVTTEVTSESLGLTEARYATLSRENGTDDKSGVTTFGKTSPEKEEEKGEKEVIEKEGSEIEKKDESVEDASLKARVQRYSTKKVGKHHVESVEVDFFDSDDEDLTEVPEQITV